MNTAKGHYDIYQKAHRALMNYLRLWKIEPKDNNSNKHNGTKRKTFRHCSR